MTIRHQLEHFRDLTKMIEVVTFCNRVGFLASGGTLSRSLWQCQRLAAFSSATLGLSSFGWGDWPVGRFAFPVTVEVNLPKRKNRCKHFLAKK